MSEFKYAIEQGAGGWWVCQLGVDRIDPAVLKDAASINLWNWGGVIYRGVSKFDVEDYLKEYIHGTDIVRNDD